MWVVLPPLPLPVPLSDFFSFRPKITKEAQRLGVWMRDYVCASSAADQFSLLLPVVQFRDLNGQQPV